MSSLRLIGRAASLTLHVVIGVLLTPLSLRPVADHWRTHTVVTEWWHNRLADILGLSITVSGYRPQAPALLVANHVSWLDIIVLGALTPTDFLSKHEVRQWPLIGWLAARSGTLFIRRGDGQTAIVSEQIAARLQGGRMLTLFPEGTTTDGREVRPFHSRLFSAALSTGSDIVPVGLRYHVDGDFDPVAPYTDNQSLLTNLAGLLRRERTQVHVACGRPLDTLDRSRKQVASAAREHIVAALEAHRDGAWRSVGVAAG
jgi:1-acyl-sn-glycerol-3-phosphate acyltransferase